MAERRMFTKKITMSDAFLDMPVTARLLYYDLNMNADDDGFVGNPKTVIRITGARDDDIKILLAKRFILSFESGIIVIKHWKMHNCIQSDRYKATVYSEEYSTLTLNQNKSYTECIQNVSISETQDRLGKDRLDKDSINKEDHHEKSKLSFGIKKNVLMADKEYASLVDQYSKKLIDEYIDRVSLYISTNGRRYKDHHAVVLTWMRKDGVKPVTHKKIFYHEKHCPICYQLNNKLVDLPEKMCNDYVCECGSDGKTISEVLLRAKNGV